MAPTCEVPSAVDTASWTTGEPTPAARLIRAAGYAVVVTGYVAIGAAATIIFPAAIIIFLLPIALGVIKVAPAARAAPRKLVFGLLAAAAFLLPMWPPYLFLKLGPAPALIPPRIILYAVSAIWVYDIVFSPLRRAQFIYALKKGGLPVKFFFCLFAIGLMSLPFAEGRAIAAPEYFRHVAIWFVPFCAVITYCRRQRDFASLLRWMTLGAVPVALVAIIEFATHQLFANVLSPFISDDEEWLRNVQALKIRDGVFRAQATHTHPLSLGEHLAFAAPFALAFALSARQLRDRAFWHGSFAIIAAAAVATNSRGAMIVMAISVGAMTGILLWRALRRASASRWRPLAGLAFLCLVATAPAGALVTYGIISGKGGVSAANSTQSRIDQIEMAWPKILKRPVGGYGTGRSARILGYWGRMLTIDNYYLSLALDYGFPGPIAFLAMLVAWAASAIRRSTQAHPHLGVIYLAMFASILAIAVDRTIISLTSNLTMIYFMLAAFAGASVTFSHRRARNRA